MRATGRLVFVVANPKAGNRKTEAFLPKALIYLKKNDIAYELFTTEREDHIAELFTENWHGGFTDILVLGGDGTLHEVVNSGFLKCPVGMVHTGTANDFAKALFNKKLSHEVQLKRALTAEPRLVDLGECNGVLFHNGVGIGFDGMVAHKVKKMEVEQKKAVWAYYSALASIILKYKSSRMKVWADGERAVDEPLFLATIGNGKAFGGGFYLTPEASVEDGILDICLIKKVNFLERLWRLPYIPFGKHLSMSVVRYSKAKEIILHSREELPYHIDGETFWGRKFNIQIHPQMLKLRY